MTLNITQGRPRSRSTIGQCDFLFLLCFRNSELLPRYREFCIILFLTIPHRSPIPIYTGRAKKVIPYEKFYISAWNCCRFFPTKFTAFTDEDSVHIKISNVHGLIPLFVSYHCVVNKDEYDRPIIDTTV